jgi:hypothetical protein
MLLMDNTSTIGVIKMMNAQLVQSIWMMIQALSHEEQGWLRSRFVQVESAPVPKVVNLNSFSGSIRLGVDPLEYQRQLRDEWM